MDDFLLRALLAGCGLALMAGPFGCVVVWRKMAYFGDSLAHGALLGVVLGVAWQGDPQWGMILAALVMAAGQAWLHNRPQLSSDTLLGIISHTTLALGLVLLSQMENLRINVLAWLLGDILAVSWNDTIGIWLGGGLALLGLWRLWPSLLLMAVDDSLAAAEGHSLPRTRLSLLLLTAVVVALSMKVVGILLVTALLVIPAAAARPLAADPEPMAALAAVLGCVAVVTGIATSWFLDSPTGPTIVLAAALLFTLSHILSRLRRR